MLPPEPSRDDDQARVKLPETLDHTESPSTQHPTADETTVELASGAKAPQVIGGDQPGHGRYELLSEIARGGMGVVYRARQKGLNRIVALKMILSGTHAGDEEVQRFLAEAEAAAGLDHPAIVPIHEIGQFEGQPYFTMGYVEGASLAHRLMQGPLPPREAAELTRKVSDAVQYAHEHGVIHRDLKPSNVLVDQSGEPRVTDFGLAKRMAVDSELTVSGQVLGTPSFMPPEQAEGQLDQVGPLADVYSLGALLYATTTGRPPFSSGNVAETLRQVIEKEPVSPRKLNPELGRDLDTIILKCLNKDPKKRYASAGELSADLQRFLEHRSIVARRANAIERGMRWCRRQPVVATLLILLVASVTAGLVTSWRFAVDAGRQAKQAEANERVAMATAEQLKISEENERQRRLEAERQRRVADSNRLAAEARATVANTPRIALRSALAAMEIREDPDAPPSRAARLALRKVLSSVGGRSVASHEAFGRGQRPLLANKFNVLVSFHKQNILLADLNTGRNNWMALDGYPNHYGIRRGGDQVAVPMNDGTVELWSLSELGEFGVSNGTEPPTPVVLNPLSHVIGDRQRLRVREIATTDDGQQVCLCLDGQLQVWNVGDLQRPRLSMPLNSSVTNLTCSGDHRFVAGVVRSQRNSSADVFLVDVSGEQPVPRKLGCPGSKIAFSPSGLWLTASHLRKLHVFRLDGEEPQEVLAHEFPANASSVVWDPGEQWLAVSHEGDDIAVWNAHEMRLSPQPSLPANSSRVDALSVSSNGQWLAGATQKNLVSVWEMRSRSPETSRRDLRGQQESVHSIQFSEDSKHLFAAAVDGVVHRWALPDAGANMLVASPTLLNQAATFAFTADNQHLVVYDPKLGVQRWRLNVGGVSLEEDPPFRPLTIDRSRMAPSFSSDGRWLVGVLNQRLYRWDLSASNRPSSRQAIDRSVGSWRGLTISPDGQWVSAEESHDKVYMWRLDSREPSDTRISLSTRNAQNTLRTFSSNGKFAVGSIEGTVRLWDLEAPDVAGSLLGASFYESPVGNAAAQPPGVPGAFAPPTSPDRSLPGPPPGALRPGPPGAPPPFVVPPKNIFPVIAVSISDDGRWLAACNLADGLRVWKVGRELELQFGDSGFAVGGDTKFVGQKFFGISSRQVSVWDLAADPQFRSPQSYFIESATRQLSPEGSTLAAFNDGVLSLYDLTSDNYQSIVLQDSERPVSKMSFSHDGRWLLTSSNRDSQMRLWLVRDDDLVALARDLSEGNAQESRDN